MAATAPSSNNDASAKPNNLASVYAEKLDNIEQIRGTLENLLTDIDHHDQALTKGFDDIHALIAAQRKKFETLGKEFDLAQQAQQGQHEQQLTMIVKAVDDAGDAAESPAIAIKVDVVPAVQAMADLEVPAKREPIKSLPLDTAAQHDRSRALFVDDEHGDEKKEELDATDVETEPEDEPEPETEEEEEDEDENMSEAMLAMLEQEKVRVENANSQP